MEKKNKGNSRKILQIINEITQPRPGDQILSSQTLSSKINKSCQIMAVDISAKCVEITDRDQRLKED